jgi:hypothetical protein
MAALVRYKIVWLTYIILLREMLVDYLTTLSYNEFIQGELVTEEMSANPIFSNSVKFNQIHN